MRYIRTFLWQHLCITFLSLICFHTIHAQEFWLIQANINNPGFFSYFNAIIGILDLYDKNKNATGISIDCGTLGWYYDPAKGPNWWSYYFEPMTSELSQGKTVHIFNDPVKLTNFSIAGFHMQRDRAYELICKYIKVRPHILTKVNDFIQKHFNGFYVIGLHYRGTDKKSESLLVSYETVYKAIKKILQDYGKNQIRIFVATDDSNLLLFLETKFPRLIISTTAHRSENNQAVHTAPTGSPSAKGEEALIDCLLLSRCMHFIKTSSNLGEVAMQFNPRLPVTYLSKPFGSS